MSNQRNKVLTIAGFDPSGGAGLLADIKTFESNSCLGFAINTANTIQHENEFVSPNWIAEEEVFNQLNLILKQHEFKYIKIGLIASLDFLKRLIANIQFSISNCKLVWDPILSASAGFDFKHDLAALKEVLKHIYLITPNWNEAQQLTGNKDGLKGAEALSIMTNVYLKGGHNLENLGKDYLFVDGKTFILNPKIKKPIFEKHGSGCVFSAVLTANLAKDYSLLKACLRSKRYVEHFLSSSPTLLGYHKI
jgi:hydroxymethylpyrimidine/phosphomethylpyrimidine kinase